MAPQTFCIQNDNGALSRRVIVVGFTPLHPLSVGISYDLIQVEFALILTDGDLKRRIVQRISLRSFKNLNICISKYMNIYEPGSATDGLTFKVNSCGTRLSLF